MQRFFPLGAIGGAHHAAKIAVHRREGKLWCAVRRVAKGASRLAHSVLYNPIRHQVRSGKHKSAGGLKGGPKEGMANAIPAQRADFFHSYDKWCRTRDLNPRPPAYEADALPAELVRPGRDMTSDAARHVPHHIVSSPDEVNTKGGPKRRLWRGIGRAWPASQDRGPVMADHGPYPGAGPAPVAHLCRIAGSGQTRSPAQTCAQGSQPGDVEAICADGL